MALLDRLVDALTSRLHTHGLVGKDRRGAQEGVAETDRRWASDKRQVIEQAISQLKDLFSLERHRSKTLGDLFARLVAKVAAYTCGQRLNSLLGRPLPYLAELLV